MPHLFQNPLRLTAPLPSPDVGDDAVGTEVVAAVHNGDPGFQLALTHHRQTLGNASGVVRRLKDPLLLVQHLTQKLREFPQHMGAENQIYVTEGLFDLLRHVGLLHGAAAKTDDLAGLAAFRVGQSAHVAQNPHLGVLPDGAGVDDNDVRLTLVLGKSVAHLREHPPDLLRVRLVLLAAVGVHHGKGLLRETGDTLVQLLPNFPLAVQLFGRDQYVVSFQRSSS